MTEKKPIKGSQLCMLRLINDTKATQKVAEEIGVDGIEWKSPNVAGGKIKENCLDKNMQKELWPQRKGKSIDFSWWPSSGKKPQWDAIGISNDGTVILIEAKAHPKEMISACSAKEKSRLKIYKTMNDVQRMHFKGCKNFDEIWMNKYYQLANRLTFFVKLTEEENLNIKLVFLSFFNDNTHIQKNKSEFCSENKKVFEKVIGAKEFLDENICSIYFDAGDLSELPKEVLI